MTKQDLDRYCEGLQPGQDGIFVSRLAGEQIHFPEQGHATLANLEDDSFWFRHRNRCIVAAVRKYPPSGPLFDVGGGNGYVARGLEESGVRVVLVEPGAAGCATAHRRGLSTVVNADFYGARFIPGSVPGIGLFDVIEHVEDDRAFLRSVSQALAPGGRLYVTVPAYSWLWSQVDAASGHFRRYTMASLGEAVAAAGLVRTYATCFFQPLIPAILLTRVLMGILRKPERTVANTSSEHSRTLAARCLESLLRYESYAISKGVGLPFGASLLLVASKP